MGEAAVELVATRNRIRGVVYDPAQLLVQWNLCFPRARVSRPAVGLCSLAKMTVQVTVDVPYVHSSARFIAYLF